jgi:hypothetical protein
MGNYNSGPTGRSSGISVEVCESIDASRWSREGVLRKGAKRLELASSSESGERHEYTVFLVETRPNFGGSRLWFQCPLCGSRVRKLFLPPRGNCFGCRRCHRLTYNSRKECPDGRYWSTLQKIYRRLGGDVYSDPEFPPKPKGMWERTYYRLMERAEAAPEVRLWRVLRRRATRRYPLPWLRS